MNMLKRIFGGKDGNAISRCYEDALVIRTVFANDEAWQSICEEIRKPVGEFRAYVEFVNDPKFKGVTADQIRSKVVGLTDHSFLFMVDSKTFESFERTIQVVDLSEESHDPFRVIPSEVWGIENNLSVSNMGFEEFAESVDEDGVFRGFPES